MAIVGLGNTLAREGEKRGVFVNTVAPVAASRMTEAVLPAELFAALKPEAVAPVVLWLCHESCSANGGAPRGCVCVCVCVCVCKCVSVASVCKCGGVVVFVVGGGGDGGGGGGTPNPAAAFVCAGLFEVGGGWAAQVRWERSKGASFPLAFLSLESVRDGWVAVTDFTDATHPGERGEGAPRGARGGTARASRVCVCVCVHRFDAIRV
jgi:hypothetical protein